MFNKKILFITGFVEQHCQACCIDVTKRELIVLSLTKKREIVVLRAIKCDDKSHIPSELKYIYTTQILLPYSISVMSCCKAHIIITLSI